FIERRHPQTTSTTERSPLEVDRPPKHRQDEVIYVNNNRKNPVYSTPYWNMNTPYNRLGNADAARGLSVATANRMTPLVTLLSLTVFNALR
ncbi:hypothetical protein MAR_024492, partial [Mya arenaria]